MKIAMLHFQLLPEGDPSQFLMLHRSDKQDSSQESVDYKEGRQHSLKRPTKN